MATKILSVELTQGLVDFPNLKGYNQALVLVRSHGRPLGRVWVQFENETLRAADLRSAIEADGELSWWIAEDLLTHWMMPKSDSAALPTWSVVVCTRNRTEDLRRCLDALLKIPTPGGEIIVVDNAPSDEKTRELVANYPVRYTRENRQGLNWARTHGARVAKGEIVIYTDDDVIVDEGWVAAILEPFSNPRVAAATGLVLPYELETASQEIFELRYGGFGRGFQRKVFDYTMMSPTAAGRVGAGANMAFRRELITKMRLFESELDCGTVAQTGGDAYACYLLLAEGYQIIYTPDALVWHRHRRDYAALKRTIVGYTVGGIAFLTRCWLQHGDWQALKTAYWWIKDDHIRRVNDALKRRRNHLPLDIALAQLFAIPTGVKAYFITHKQ
jgi:GT2 family glycosyltransferase